MSDADFVLELETETVAVGDEVKGYVSAPADTKAGPGVPASVQLLWRTSGECESEEKIVASQDIPLDESGRAALRLRVPAAGPMTYAGRTLSISWCVRIPAEQPVEKGLSVVAALKPPQSP